MSTPWERGREVAQVLRGAGHAAWYVGGCVRDHLLGRAVADVDICSSATPDQVAALFPRCLLVGRSFGVVVVVAPDGGHVEVATFRRDGLYIDGRRPSEVAFATVDEDVARRDFTINALLMDPVDGRIVDLVGGRPDLEQRLLRVVGDPHARLSEDRLRVLRGIRFAAGLGLTWDPASWAAACATSVAGLSRERICQEIDKALAGGAPGTWLAQLAASGHLPEVLPVLGSEAQAQAIAALARTAHREIRWAILLCLGADAESWLEAQPLAKERRRHWLWLRSALRAWPTAGRAQRRRWLQAPGATDLAALAEALDGDAAIAQALAAEQALGRFQPLLQAGDLLATGIAPGPQVGRILHAVEEAQLEERCTTRAEALALVARLRTAP